MFFSSRISFKSFSLETVFDDWLTKLYIYRTNNCCQSFHLINDLQDCESAKFKRWHTQCTQTQKGLSSWIRAVIPFKCPVITEAPSVPSPKTFVISIPESARICLKTWYIALAVPSLMTLHLRKTVSSLAVDMSMNLTTVAMFFVWSISTFVDTGSYYWAFAWLVANFYLNNGIFLLLAIGWLWRGCRNLHYHQHEGFLFLAHLVNLEFLTNLSIFS